MALATLGGSGMTMGILELTYQMNSSQSKKSHCQNQTSPTEQNSVGLFFIYSCLKKELFFKNNFYKSHFSNS